MDMGTGALWQPDRNFYLFEQGRGEWWRHRFDDEEHARAWIIATGNRHMHRSCDVHGNHRAYKYNDHYFDPPPLAKRVEALRWQLAEARQAQADARRELAEAQEHMVKPALPRISRAFVRGAEVKEFFIGQTVTIASKPPTEAKVIGFGQGSVLVEFLNPGGDKLVLREVHMERSGSGLTFDAISLTPLTPKTRQSRPRPHPARNAVSRIFVGPNVRVVQVSEVALVVGE